jgi:hypothetical protein
MVKDNQPGLEADLRAGFGFDDTARAIAAATSPCGRAAARAAAGAHGDQPGQGARPPRAANAAGHVEPDGGAEVARAEAGA